MEGLRATSVIDVGCGTGTLACFLAQRGLSVVGMDPATASLDVARSKPGADRVRWLYGDATVRGEIGADLAVMTGNVAQVFVTDEDWNDTLGGIAWALRPGGHLVLEVRNPARRAWQTWNRESSLCTTNIAGVGPVESWVDLMDVSGSLVSFRWTYRFERTGEVLTSESTLRFRSQDEIRSSLDMAGFAVTDLRDAPDRPGLEWVFVAERTD